MGRMESLGFSSRTEAVLNTLTQDVLKSCEIEGEILDLDQVRSSNVRHLGIDIGTLAQADRNVDGVVELILDATQQYLQSLTRERLFGWHALLFPATGRRVGRITVGAWRNDAMGQMQVVSGPLGRDQVQFEAPPSKRIKQEMAGFLDWFNGDDTTDLVLKAGIAHLRFFIILSISRAFGHSTRDIESLVPSPYKEVHHALH